MSAIKPLRATPDLWTYKVKTNDGKAIVESSGAIDANLGEALRVLQIHIVHLTPREQDMLFTLTECVTTRLKRKTQ